MYIDLKSYIAHQWHRATTTQRGRIVITIIAPIILLTVWLYGIYTPICAKIQGNKYMLCEVTKEIETINTFLSQAPQQKNDLSAVNHKWSSYTTHSADFGSSCPTAFLQSMHKAGLTLESCTLSNTKDKEWYKNEQINFSYVGPVEKVVTFFTEIQKLPLPATYSFLEFMMTDQQNAQIKGELRFMIPHTSTAVKNEKTLQHD
jgi:hypothetical protein